MGADKVDAGEIDSRVESLRQIDQRIIDALIRARAHLGLQHRADMAKLMNQATGGGGPDVSTYNRWEEGSRRVPAWALLVAAQVSGLSTAQLLEEMPSQERPRPEYEARLSRVEKTVDRMLKTLTEELERRHNGSDSTAAG